MAVVVMVMVVVATDSHDNGNGSDGEGDGDDDGDGGDAVDCNGNVRPGCGSLPAKQCCRGFSSNAAHNCPTFTSTNNKTVIRKESQKVK